MRKVVGLLALGALFGICLTGCETAPTAKPVAAGTVAPGAALPKSGAADSKAASTSIMPTANPDYTGTVGSKAK